MPDENVVQVSIIGRDDGATDALRLTRDQIIALANGSKDAASALQSQAAASQTLVAATQAVTATHGGFSAALHENRTGILAATRAMHGFQRAMGEAGDGTARTASLLVHSFATGGPAALAIGATGLAVEELVKWIVKVASESATTSDSFIQDAEDETVKVNKLNEAIEKRLELEDIRARGGNADIVELNKTRRELELDREHLEGQLGVKQHELEEMRKPIEKMASESAAEFSRRQQAQNEFVEQGIKGIDTLKSKIAGLTGELNKNAGLIAHTGDNADDAARKKRHDDLERAQKHSAKSENHLQDERRAYERQAEEEQFAAFAQLGDKRMAAVAERYHREEQAAIEAKEKNILTEKELVARLAEIDRERDAAFGAVKEDEAKRRAMKEEELAQRAAERAKRDAAALAKKQAAEIAKTQGEYDKAGERLGVGLFHGIIGGIEKAKHGDKQGAGKEILKAVLGGIGGIAGFALGGPAGFGLGASLGSDIGGLFHTGGYVGRNGERLAHTGQYMSAPGTIGVLGGEAVLDPGTTANLGGPAGISRLIANKGAGIGGSVHMGDTHVTIQGSASAQTVRDLEAMLKQVAIERHGQIGRFLGQSVPGLSRS